MEQFLLKNASAVFAVLGTLAGVVLTFISTSILQRLAVKNRLVEKILDRRISAHENIIEISKSLRTMMSLGYDDSEGQLARTPSIMASRESFEEFHYLFNQKVAGSSTWLSTEVTREVNFIQDYLVNLYELVRFVNTEKFPEIGMLIRQDFIDFSTKLEQLSFIFFSSELMKLKLNDLSKWHKYPLVVTEKRLAETQLSKKLEEIKKM